MIDIVRLDNWLRGVAVEIDGQSVVFPDGREHFAALLRDERIGLERSATERAEREAKIAAHPYTYCHVETQRKVWHLDDAAFDDWDHIERDRDDYTDTYTFRKLTSALTEADKALVESYGSAYNPFIHDEMVARWEKEEAARHDSALRREMKQAQRALEDDPHAV